MANINLVAIINVNCAAKLVLKIWINFLIEPSQLFCFGGSLSSAWPCWWSWVSKETSFFAGFRKISVGILVVVLDIPASPYSDLLSLKL